jgi:hypothetical protein
VTLVGQKTGREISARALLDSGAEGIIVDHAFAIRNGLTLRTLTRPIPVKNVDGSLNKKGPVKYTTIQTIRIKNSDDDYHEERSELYVTSLGDHDIILGTDWLKAHNPEVNWRRPQLALTRCPPTCILSRKPLIIESRYKQSDDVAIHVLEPQVEDEPLSVNEFSEDASDPFGQMHYQEKNKSVHIRSKTTTSTELATRTAPRPSTEHIPAEFQKYAKVFSEEASKRLPEHQPWDHAIDLLPGKPMKKCGLYRLTPKEDVALKEYVTHGLMRRVITRREIWKRQ